MPWPTPNVYTMTTPRHAAIDTNVLVALVDRRDHWHAGAHALREALQRVATNVVYFDSVINEAVSVLARRAQEQGRSSQFLDLLDILTHQVPPEAITWVSAETERLYDQVIALVRNTSGKLNFHDALIALGCRELAIANIVSFDPDFEQVTWLTRVETPDAVMTAFRRAEGD
jgi:predicted nucleic acid-binding protein